MSAPAPAPARPSTTEGCDSCGVDGLGRPLRLAAVRIDLPSGGRLFLCGSHEAAHAPALLTSGATITAIDA